MTTWTVQKWRSRDPYPPLPEHPPQWCPYHTKDTRVPTTMALFIRGEWYPMCREDFDLCVYDETFCPPYAVLEEGTDAEV